MTDNPSPTQPVVLTRAGHDRLQKNLQSLREELRPAVLDRIKRASLFMDPSRGGGTGAAARNELDMLDRLIAEREETLAGARVIPDVPTSVVQLGSTVTVRFEDGAEKTFTLVSPFEAELTPGAVSSESPAGKALLGKAPGADVSVGAGEDAVSLSVVSVGKTDAEVDTTNDTASP